MVDKKLREGLTNDEFTELLKTYMTFLKLEIDTDGLADDARDLLFKHIKVTAVDDWVKHQICGDLPVLDPRCLIFCCSPSKNCPYRMIALAKLGLNTKKYTEIKKRLAAEFNIYKQS